MKRLLTRVLPAVIALCLLTSSAMAQGKIGTIDLRKVFDGYWKTKQADAGLKERAADMEKEHKNMIEDLKKAEEDYRGILSSANDQAVSEEERDRRKKSAEEKLRYMEKQRETIGQYERQARTTLDEQRRRMRENILGEIRTVVNGKAKAGSFTMILDTAAESINNTPVVIYTTGENDITDDVLKELNATAPAGTDLTKPVTASPDKKDGKDSKK
jgi:Skp family chaperone for outer membrane proteins